MIKVDTQYTPWKYVPKSQRVSDTPAEFTLKPLTGEEYMSVMLEAGLNADGRMVLTARGLMMAVKFGVTGWSGVDTCTGSLTYSRDAIHHLPYDDLIDIATEIVNKSQVSGEPEKN